MKNFNIFLLAVLLLFTGCDGDENFLTKSPTDIFVDEDVWKNEALIMGLVSDLYSRYADYQTIEKWYSFCDLDEGYCSNAVDRKRHQNATWGYGEQASWDYGYVRHMNLFLQKCARADASVFAKNSRERLMGEVRFLRAAYYFAMAKRMGGVPLITEPMQYDYSGDVTYLYRPRNPEYEIYDFVLKECEEIKTLLPNDPSVKSRATKAAALAMRSRAALYAGSIARYGALRTPEVTLPGGEVGIPAEKADYYYGIALSSAQEIMTDNLYDLYKKNPSDLADNFASMFLDKTDANTEAIFVKDFLSPNKIHNYTVYTLPQSMSEYPRYNGSLCATLNLVQLYELLDGNKIEPLKVGTPASPGLLRQTGRPVRRARRASGRYGDPAGKFVPGQSRRHLGRLRDARRQADHRQRPRRRRHPARNDGEGAGRRQGRPVRSRRVQHPYGFLCPQVQRHQGRFGR